MTTSVGRTSASTTRASWRAARRTWIGSPPRACASPTTTRKRAAPPVARTSSPGELPMRTGLTTVGQAGLDDRHARRGADDRDDAQVDGLRDRTVRQEPPRRSQPVSPDAARLRRVLRVPLPPRRDGGPLSPDVSAGAQGQGRPAAHGPHVGDERGGRQGPTRAGARSASRRSRTPASSVRSAWRPSTTRSSTRRSSSSTRRKHDGKPFMVWLNPTRMHVDDAPLAEIREPAHAGERLDDRGSGHVAARRHRRRGDAEGEGHGHRERHHPRASRPTTARRTSRGPTAVRRRSRAAKERRSRAASACR